MKREGRKGNILLLLLIVAVLLTGCSYEDQCRETCESRNLLYHSYLSMYYGADVCLCKTVEGEIESAW